MLRPFLYICCLAAAYCHAGFSGERRSSALNSSIAQLMTVFISIPATAMGRRPTAESTLYLPPTSSGTTKHSQPSASARDLSTPRCASVVAKMCFLAALPYFSLSSFLKTRKASAGSSVVPDFEITLTSKSMSPSWSRTSFRASGERPLPTKNTLGSSAEGTGRRSSMAPRAPR